ncbi:ABC transporter ATP-binding protein [Microbulbifer sp. S227A]|uniref:ABC transporter ATP-binding protein n=1 Tax=Microbulbifer sp. S227A TaxID=3415131 RepID=UPI003C7ED9A3
MRDTHLHIERISKSYGTVQALSEVDLQVARGAFVCLLGPSGCGKTTLLRIIAGFEQASSGRLLQDGSDITAMAPHRRGFGMVFQSLALFPHMSVAENIAYGLKLRKASRAEQADRVEELLTVIELPHIADRPVSALSGGQRQRVAIARALAIRPKLFLLDEPLSALDAKLRDNMQIELRRLQQSFGVTTVLVTHDQTEALMLADELVVLNQGVVQQTASPTEVYRNPATPFVADFIGAANLLPATVTSLGTLGILGQDTGLAVSQAPGSTLQAAVRAEAITLERGAETGTVSFARDLGPVMEWLVETQGHEIRVRGAGGAAPAQTGDRVGLRFDAERITVFAA